MIDLDKIEKACGYEFKDKKILVRALTLSSYDNNLQNNNESLECLGDALLTFIIAEKYFLKGCDEGQISQQKQIYLSDKALTPVSESLGLDKALLRDKGDTVNKKAIPSAYEALIGAIYIDGGLENARRVALSTLKASANPTNYIAALQELLQSFGERPPQYIKSSAGTPQAPVQRIKVTVHNKTFKGEGQNFATAKKIAAKKAYEWLIKCEKKNKGRK